MNPGIAIVRGSRLYTLRPYRDPWGRKTTMKWVGYIDGNRCGYFRSKKDWEAWVEQDAKRGIDPLTQASYEVEQKATNDGMEILDKLRRWNGVRR